MTAKSITTVNQIKAAYGRESGAALCWKEISKMHEAVWYVFPFLHSLHQCATIKISKVSIILNYLIFYAAYGSQTDSLLKIQKQIKRRGWHPFCAGKDRYGRKSKTNETRVGKGTKTEYENGGAILFF